MDGNLIKKYFDNECSAEEAEEVISYLRSNPDILSQYMTEKDWELFGEGRKSRNKQKSWAVIADAIGIEKDRNKSKVKWLYRAVAACIVFIVGVVFVSRMSSKDETPSDKIEALVFHKGKTIFNPSTTDMEVTLPDHSVVVLCPNSSIVYKDSFGYSKRDVFLEGKAKFMVAKDKIRPFSVFSGNTVTTALGTVFWVSHEPKSVMVKVKLLEGCVMVRLNKKGIAAQRLALLKPGNEYVYQPFTGKDSLDGNYAQSSEPKRIEKTSDSKLVLSFDKLSVDKVLDSVGNRMHVKIEYPKNKAKGVIYTGTFNPSNMSIHAFLKELCLLNGWSVNSRNPNNYEIEISQSK